MKRLQQLILWLADGVWYAMLLLTVSASAQISFSGAGGLSGTISLAAETTVVAAPTFDSASNLTGGNSDSSLTWSHTNSGSSRLLLVSAYQSSSNIASVTYAGTALSNVFTYTGGSICSSLWALVNPATGSNNIVLTFAVAESYTCGAAVSFTGVNQTTPFGASTTNNAYQASITNSLATAASDLVVDCIVHGSTFPTDVTNGPAQTLRSTGTRYDSTVAMSTAPGTGGTVDMIWSASSGWSVAGAVVLKQ